MNEREKKDAGLWYLPSYDHSTRDSLLRAKKLCYEVNKLSPLDGKEQQEIFKELIGELGEKVFILTPFYCDYGYNIRIGKNTFINHNAYLMDCAPITIGEHVLIGPSCGIYTAIHPTHPEDRSANIERAAPIVIEDDVWIGGDVTIVGGVRIGAGSVIGAKSLVNRDIPRNSIAVGNPCRVVREITDEDRIDPEIYKAYYE